MRPGDKVCLVPRRFFAVYGLAARVLEKRLLQVQFFLQKIGGEEEVQGGDD